MPPSRLHASAPLRRHPFVWLTVASLLLTFVMRTTPPDAVRAMQDDSPTNTPAPTFTSPPPTAVATNTPTFTATPADTATAPPPPAPDATTPPPESATPVPDTATPPVFETPTATLIPSDTPAPPVILATATPPPVLAPTEALTATLVITQTGGAAPLPAQDADALVELIDAFILYSAYFLLGCGVIVFIALAVGFFFLNRRTRTPD